MRIGCGWNSQHDLKNKFYLPCWIAQRELGISHEKSYPYVLGMCFE